MLKPRPVTIHCIHFLDATISAGADRSAAVLRHHSIIKTLTVGNFLDSRRLLTFPESKVLWHTPCHDYSQKRRRVQLEQAYRLVWHDKALTSAFHRQ